MAVELLFSWETVWARDIYWEASVPQQTSRIHVVRWYRFNDEYSRAVATIGAYGQLPHKTFKIIKQWQYYYGDLVKTLQNLINNLKNFGGFASELHFIC